MGCGSSAPVTANAPTDKPVSSTTPQSVQMGQTASSGEGKRRSAQAAPPASAKPKKITDAYDLSETIGKGGFGEVKRAKRKADGAM